MLIIALLVALLFPSLVQAQVIDTQEWETKPGLPWSYSSGQSGTGASVDCTVTPSPSGGCALRMVYPAGTYSTSFGGGRASRDITGNPTDLYIGAWMRYSNPFQFHSNGQKVNFWILSQTQRCNGLSNPAQTVNVAIGYIGAGGNATLASSPQVCWNGAPLSQIFFQNAANWDETAHLNQWHWYEMRSKMNTPGQADGINQVWIDDILYLDIQNVRILNTGESGGHSGMQHTAEYGGGGSTIATTQYWWIDHTVLSTARIGMPGGTPVPTDTTPPTAPTSLVAQ